MKRCIWGGLLPFVGVRDLDPDLAVEMGRAHGRHRAFEIEWFGFGFTLAVWEAKP